ncbi:MAG: Uma2 family endonuclease, partial [Anaerolineae bacterium]|nr:Uma2 family endonuclease [Anaerolineae bacterium]
DELPPLSDGVELVELIEGEIMVKGSPSTKHQRLVLAIARMLLDTVPDGHVFIAPLSVRLDDYNSFQPDVFWVSANNPHCEIREDQVVGARDLAVEVISPGSARIDRGIKFEKYQEHGVREYWLVEPELAFLQVWLLQDGRYTQHGIFAAGETFSSATIGKEVPLQNVFPE